jgi:hypothetical protein
MENNECNQETKCCEHKTFEILNMCCKNNLKSILKTIKEEFVKNNILYWIDYGTLLGAVREGDIITTDDDCDIGILRQDAEKVLSMANTFRLKGMLLNVYFYPNFIRLDYSRINDLHVDIFIWNIKYNNIKTYLSLNSFSSKHNLNKGKEIDIEMLFPLSKINFGGEEYSCPNEPEKFVEFRYGKDWRIPKNI